MKRELLFEGHGSLYHIADVRKVYCIGDKVKRGNMARKMEITNIIIKANKVEYRISLNQHK